MMHPLRALGLASLLPLSLAAVTGCGPAVTPSGSGGGGGAGSSSSSSLSSSSSSSSASVSSSSSSSASASSSSGGPACMPGGMSDLPGVHIDVSGAVCTFSLSDPAKVTIAYQVVVDQDTSGVIPVPQDAGGCGAPGSSGLITFEKVDGGNQIYCICDEGKCGPPSNVPVTLKMGSYPGAFTWDKHNWTGPSDTANPEGPLFLAGDYMLTVSAVGSRGGAPFSVTGTLPIHLLP